MTQQFLYPGGVLPAIGAPPPSMSEIANSNFTELFGSLVLAGAATLDFGSGAMAASIVVTGVNKVLATSVVSAFTRIEATPQHSVDELLVDPIRVFAHSLVVGTGFTITGRMDNAPANGTYKIDWLVN